MAKPNKLSRKEITFFVGFLIVASLVAVGYNNIFNQKSGAENFATSSSVDKVSSSPMPSALSDFKKVFVSDLSRNLADNDYISAVATNPQTGQMLYGGYNGSDKSPSWQGKHAVLYLTDGQSVKDLGSKISQADMTKVSSIAYGTKNTWLIGENYLKTGDVYRGQVFVYDGHEIYTVTNKFNSADFGIVNQVVWNAEYMSFLILTDKGVFIYDLNTRTVSNISAKMGLNSATLLHANSAISNNGKWVVAGDTYVTGSKKRQPFIGIVSRALVKPTSNPKDSSVSAIYQSVFSFQDITSSVILPKTSANLDKNGGSILNIAVKDGVYYVLGYANSAPSLDLDKNSNTRFLIASNIVNKTVMPIKITLQPDNGYIYIDSLAVNNQGVFLTDIDVNVNYSNIYRINSSYNAMPIVEAPTNSTGVNNGSFYSQYLGNSGQDLVYMSGPKNLAIISTKNLK